MGRLLWVLIGVLSTGLVFGQGGGFSGASPDGRNVSQRDGMKIFRDGGILTASEDAPYPVHMKPGDTLWISVASSEFDTAARVVDESGTLLAENDDAAPGTQNSQMIYAFDKEADYKVVVGGFKSKSGGRYQIEMRLFHSFTPELGKKVDFPFYGNDAVFVRMTGKTGDYRAVRWWGVPGEGFEFLTGSGVMPTSIEIPSRGREGGRAGVGVLMGRDEDVYLRLRPTRAGSTQVRVDMAEQLTMDGPQSSLSIGAAGVAIVSLTGKAGQLVDLRSADGQAMSVWDDPGLFLAKKNDKEVVNFDPNSTQQSESVAVAIGDPGKSAPAKALLFKKDGEKKFLVLMPGIEGGRLQSSIVGIPVSAGGSWKGKLGLGETVYYAFDGKAGDWLDFSVMSTLFDATVSLINPDGTTTVSADDSSNSRMPSMNSFLLKDGRYHVVVRCYGGGGSGEFSLSSVRRPVPVLKAGDEIVVSFADVSTKVWTMDLKAGQTLIFDQTDGEIDSMELQAADGVYEGSQSTLGGRRMLVVKVLRDGPARLWLTGSGSAKLRVRAL